MSKLKLNGISGKLAELIHLEKIKYITDEKYNKKIIEKQ